MNAAPLILAFESSCDETAVAIYRGGDRSERSEEQTAVAIDCGGGRSERSEEQNAVAIDCGGGRSEQSEEQSAASASSLPRGEVLANVVHSQIPLHRQHGGVVPELAARDHILRLPALLQEALRRAHCQLKDIDCIAYTAGPGLQGALMTGAAYARSLAFALGRPALAIHHMEGHLLSPFLAAEQPAFPFVALLVSGGHTQLMAVEGVGRYRLLGQTLDDAIGEAFDKTAKLLGLPYPGGAALSALAAQGDAKRFDLPRPMTQRQGLDFSFSGLKTQVRLLIESCTAADHADVAASFQAAVVDSVRIKCRRAWQETGYRDLVVAGGVSANAALRQALQEEARQRRKRVYFPEMELCGDNALMIAFAAAQRLHQASRDDLSIPVQARWDLASLTA